MTPDKWYDADIADRAADLAYRQSVDAAFQSLGNASVAAEHTAAMAAEHLAVAEQASSVAMTALAQAISNSGGATDPALIAEQATRRKRVELAEIVCKLMEKRVTTTTVIGGTSMGGAEALVADALLIQAEMDKHTPNMLAAFSSLVP